MSLFIREPTHVRPGIDRVVSALGVYPLVVAEGGSGGVM